MKKTFLCLCLLSITVITGCVSTPPENQPTTYRKPIIKVGVLAPLSGPGASYGQDVVEVTTRFAEQFNIEHDDIGIVLVVENGGCNGKDAASAAQKLITVDQVVAIIGGVCSSETLAAGAIAQEQGILMIAPGSASSNITEIGDWLVRTNNNTTAAEVLVAGLETAYEKVIVIAEQKDYPKDMADRFVDAYDGDVEYISFLPDDSDFSVLAKQVGDLEADALFMFTQSEATSIPLALALDDEGLLARWEGHVYGANNLLVDPFLERMGVLAEGMQEVNVADISLEYEQDVYMKTLKGYDVQGDGFTILQAADAFRMIATVVAEKKESILREDIKKFVYTFDKDIAYNGYVGTYWFDENGDAVGIDFGMYHILEGKKVRK